MKKLDLRKELRYLYKPSAKEVSAVKVPKFDFLMVDGEGDPGNSQEFQEAIQALFNVAYSLKFAVRKEMKIDYPVMALEGLWWTDDMSTFTTENKAAWKWTLMIVQPKFVTKGLVRKAIEQVQGKKSFSALAKIRFEAYNEGLSAQITHVGPFSTEGPTIEKINAYAKEHGYELHGEHHEIYLSDFRRVKPEKMKTVLRHPIRYMKLRPQLKS